MLPGQAVRIFTGAMVPNGCDAVIKREDTIETDQEIRLLPDAVADTRAGANIRREGENAPSGNEVLPVGTLIDAASTATLANFGWVRCRVYRPVRVAVLTTGDEVVDPMQCQLRPWQLRNSNRNAVCAVLRSNPFAEVALVKHLRDDPPSMLQTFRVAIEKCDAVVITGGVSMGDYDFVPDAVQSIGGRVVFHGLPIRPGKPILGATHPNGKLILGLPGNPVSATINARRFLVPCLRRMAGVSRWDDRLPLVTLSSDPRRLPLHTMLLAKLSTHGNAELVASKGSGDLVALGHSDGFVCVDADSDSPGPWPFVSW
jgi:molybdenum cofactor synthesis domain-containing protein